MYKGLKNDVPSLLIIEINIIIYTLAIELRRHSLQISREVLDFISDHFKFKVIFLLICVILLSYTFIKIITNRVGVYQCVVLELNMWCEDEENEFLATIVSTYNIFN